MWTCKLWVYMDLFTYFFRTKILFREKSSKLQYISPKNETQLPWLQTRTLQKLIDWREIIILLAILASLDFISTDILPINVLSKKNHRLVNWRLTITVELDGKHKRLFISTFPWLLPKMGCLLPNLGQCGWY